MLTLTLPQWKERLSPYSWEAFEDFSEMRQGFRYTSNEVLDIIVNYRGGIASAYELQRLVKEVYDIDLV